MSDSPNAGAPDKVFKSYMCGFCGNNTGAEVIKYVDMLGRKSLHQKYKAYLMCLCYVCKQPSLLATSSPETVEFYIKNTRLKEPFDIVFTTIKQWPSPPLKPEIPDHLPSDVHKAYLLAEKAYINGIFPPSAMQYRKSLELSCKELGEEKGSLSKNIKALGEAHKLPPDMIKWADRIRFIGNAAAHDKPLSDEDAKFEAEEIRYFSKAFMTYAFTLPQQIREYEMSKLIGVALDN